MESFGHPSGSEPNPLPTPLLREQRRSIRHKVHTPAYASLQQPATDTVLDLCEILDISERGALLQTPMGWQLGTALDLLLDFSETQTKVRARGEVVWSDAGGRVGLRFPDLSDDARDQLKQWLFLNVIVAAANHAVGVESPAALRTLPPAAAVDEPVAPLVEPATDFEEPVRSDYTTTLAALAVVQREVESLGADLEAALQLLAHRARSLTRASGSAIALSDSAGMICRASTGEAPPVGAVLDASSGLSGRCLQTGLLQRCDDAERDLRVDRESCRELNIRSVLAVPVRRGDHVLGLMEVFSPRSYAFGELEAAVLQRFSETILATLHRTRYLAPASPALTPTPAREPAKPAPRALSSAPEIIPPMNTVLFAAPLEELEPAEMGFLRRHLVVLVAFAALVMAALAYVLAPSVLGHVGISTAAAPAAAAAPSTTPSLVTQTPSIDQIRDRAEQGDPSAQFTLGTRYATGEDVDQDYSTAARWFLKAAEQGLVVAQDTLGNYYWAGRGVPRNLNQAYYWSVLAQLGGSQASRLRVQFLTSQLTPEQARSIERSAGDFFKQHPPQEKHDLR